MTRQQNPFQKRLNLPAQCRLLLSRLPLLNNYCVLFMTSNMPVKESTVMPAHPTRAAPRPEPDSPIAPHQLWGCLSRSQQQHVRTVLIRVAQHVVASLPHHQSSEETSYAPQSPSQSGEHHVAPPGAQSRDLHPPIQPQAGAGASRQSADAADASLPCPEPGVAPRAY